MRINFIAVLVISGIVLFSGCVDEKTEVSDEFCVKTGSGEKLGLTEAREIGGAGECGDRLKDTYTCNADTGTWWIDLDIVREGCNPACVINVVTKEASINWRCTGLMPELSVTEPEPDEVVVGGDMDEHGCIASAGYVWCEPKQKCIRPWVEECDAEIDAEVVTREEAYCTKERGLVVTGSSPGGAVDYCLFMASGSYCGLEDFFNKKCNKEQKYFKCDAVGSRSEGYYDAETRKLIAWANCG